ncbi:hypothetical protein J3R82DRAFT_10331 [Butyriboletus roseoflavus]|nr:hypothetical protein J3R82DRAFT_10331 [Butyriboletus roseoflavus]
MMTYVEFGVLDNDTSDADGAGWSPHESEGIHLSDPNADKANAQHGKSLESMNKRIFEELTRFRVGLPLFPSQSPQYTRSRTITYRNQILHMSLEESLKYTQSELEAAKSFQARSLDESLGRTFLHSIIVLHSPQAQVERWVSTTRWLGSA